MCGCVLEWEAQMCSNRILFQPAYRPLYSLPKRKTSASSSHRVADRRCHSWGKTPPAGEHSGEHPRTDSDGIGGRRDALQVLGPKRSTSVYRSWQMTCSAENENWAVEQLKKSVHRKPHESPNAWLSECGPP